MPRPREQLLSPQRILDSALLVIDEIDADKFTIHGVAQDLGVKTPSI
ncbi:hypothetical protein [Mycolicibacterium mucogenicum]|nr:hypothetical protein [Mycolicibacterium mucogenicum]